MSQTLHTRQSARIGELLKTRGETVAVAESSTGGLVSASLLSVPGASAFFLGGRVVYTLVSRRELLEVTARDVEGLQPLSEPMVQRFARRAREQRGATWGVAELGAARPAEPDTVIQRVLAYWPLMGP
jgi:PncC family amidohydrolase